MSIEIQRVSVLAHALAEDFSRQGGNAASACVFFITSIFLSGDEALMIECGEFLKVRALSKTTNTPGFTREGAAIFGEFLDDEKKGGGQ